MVINIRVLLPIQFHLLLFTACMVFWVASDDAMLLLSLLLRQYGFQPSFFLMIMTTDEPLHLSSW